MSVFMFVTHPHWNYLTRTFIVVSANEKQTISNKIIIGKFFLWDLRWLGKSLISGKEVDKSKILRFISKLR